MEALRQVLELRRDHLHGRLEDESAPEDDPTDLRLRLVRAERSALRKLHDQGGISRRTMVEISQEPTPTGPHCVAGPGTRSGGAQGYSVGVSASLDDLRRDAASCTRCELYEPATQTVFGEGPPSAWLVLVGEQPGDREDREGHPFVGPAGRVLDEALKEAGIDRHEVYLTNAVKHFRFERKGSRRLHKTPAATHVRACEPWLSGELSAVTPSALGLLGATAAKALLGSRFRLTVDRGKVLDHEGRSTVATTHPSAILRTPPESRDEAMAAFVRDLGVLARLRPKGS